MADLKTKLVDALGLGIGLWLIGYIASLLLYFLIPASLLGWVLFVIFTPVSLYLAYLRFRKRTEDMKYYLKIALAWALTAIILDYLFIVVAFHSQGYYKPDVFVYYATTLLVPLLIGWRYGGKQKKWWPD